jgi:hypothetical protein
LNLRDTLGSLAGMPDFLETIASRFPGDKAIAAGPAGGFGFLEQVWHLADLEACYGERIRRILCEDRPALADFDGARVAQEGRYRERSLASGLAAFRQARGKNLSVLRSVTEADWARPATQEGRGALVLADVPRMMADHDASHHGEIGELLGEARGPERTASASSSMATALMLLLVVPLLGCPYESSFSIGGPADSPRDARALGRWHCISRGDEKGFTAAIRPLEERRYALAMTMAGEEPLLLQGHVATVKGATVLNLQEIKEGKPGAKWLFARVQFPTRDSMVVETAEDALLKDLPKTEATIKGALEGDKGDAIFELTYVCARAEDEAKP